MVDLMLVQYAKCLSRKTNVYLKFKQKVVVSVNWSGCAVLPMNADGIHKMPFWLFPFVNVLNKNILHSCKTHYPRNAKPELYCNS